MEDSSINLLNYVEENYNTNKFSKYKIGYIHAFYNDLFTDIKKDFLDILEIGIHNGDSIRLWDDFFCNGNIICLDINKNEKTEDLEHREKVTCLYEDAYSLQTVKKLSAKKFDIIIDDGPHTLESFEFFIDFYFPLLKDNGIFIIEDIIDTSWSQNLLDRLPKNVDKKIIHMAGLQKSKKLANKWNKGLDVLICKNTNSNN